MLGIVALIGCDLIMPPPAEVPDPVYMLDPGSWGFEPDTLVVKTGESIWHSSERIGQADHWFTEVIERPKVYKCIPGEITMAEVQARMPGLRAHFCRDLPRGLIGIDFATADMIPCSIPEHMRGGGIKECATASVGRYEFDERLLALDLDARRYTAVRCGVAAIQPVPRPGWRDQPPLNELIPPPSPLTVVIKC